MIVQIIGLAGGGASPFDGRYLKAYNPSQDGVDPEGRPTLAHIETTDDVGEAMMFYSLGEFQATLRLVDERQPVRPDGRPNRPLTAFNLELVDRHKGRGQ